MTSGHHSDKLLRTRSPIEGVRPVVAGGVSVIVGTALLIAVLASGAYGALAIAGGTLSGHAQIVTNAGASGGKAVEFGVGGLGSPTPGSTLTPSPTATPAPTATPSPKPSPGPYQDSLAVVKGFDTDATADQTWFNEMAGDGFKVYLFDSVSWDAECANSSCSTPSTTCTIWGNAQQQIQYALNAGMYVGVYNRNPECWHNGLTGLGSYLSHVKFYVLDIESQPGIAPTTTMVNGVKALGVTPIIYSGAGMWPGITGNSTAFSNLPLQDTNVTGSVTYANWQPSLLTPTPQSYGGWNVSSGASPTGYSNLRVAMQQTFNTSLFGQSVDLDSFNSVWLAGL
jgi:hypothetical protein